MSPPPDDLGSVAPLHRSDARKSTRLSSGGAPYAVPVREVVPASGRWTEATYRGFEILAAGIALAAALPNLWCVLTGKMRLVGPRPEAPEVLQYYTPEEMYKFACKPGITGLAQVNGRGLLNWGETLAWDLQYVSTRSVWLDLKIIAITLKHVVTRHGAF